MLRHSVIFGLIFTLLTWCGLAMATGYIAIVVDDMGYSYLENEIFKLSPKISISIIPDAPFATERNSQAQQQGRNILIHLPMQPMNYHSIEKHNLHTGMNAKDVQTIMDFATSKVPNAIGLNNHMGSRATADEQLMNLLMQQLQQRNLNFLDSMTTAKSVARAKANAHGVKNLRRDIFLDDANDFPSLHQQWQKAINHARKHGVTVMIMHPRPHSLQVLKQGLANLPSDIELIKINQLWNKQTSSKFISTPPKPPAIDDPVQINSASEVDL